MPKFKNIGPSDIAAFRPEGDAQSRLVPCGETVEVPGTVVDDGPTDAYLVEHNGDRRAWPRAQWELVQDKPAKTVKEN